MKKISVIVPCYNVENLIDRCVKSLVEQSLGMEQMELIFVDDASTDRTMEHLVQWEHKYPDDILVIHCDENGKQGTARNIGMQNSSGKYIGFVDADDYVEPDMFECLTETADRENCEVVCGLYQREWEDGSLVEKPVYREDAGRREEIITIEDRKRFLKKGLTGGVWSSIYRRDFIMQNELWFPEHICYEDNYWGAVRSFVVKSYYIVNKVFYHYVVNRHSTIVQRDSTVHFDRLKIELMKLDKYAEMGVMSEFHDEIEAGFINMFYLNSLHMFFDRFTVLPYDMIYFVKDTVLHTFPDYDKNPLLKELSPLAQSLLEVMQYEWDKDIVDEIARQYREICDEVDRKRAQEEI